MWKIHIKNILKNDLIFWGIILIICTGIISHPLFTSKIFIGDDLYFHLNRIEGIKLGLLAGQFPVRIHSFQVNGYGSPVGIFYPDLFLYIPAILRICDVPVSVTYNIFSVVIRVAMAFLSWYAFALLGKWQKFQNYLRVGAVSSVFYISYWYVLMDFYERANIGETLALTFFPLALASTFIVLSGDFTKWPLIVISYTGIVQSHILSTFLLGIIVIISCGCFYKKFYDKSIRHLFLKIILIFVVINLWFLVPFISFYYSGQFNMPESFSSLMETGWHGTNLVRQQLFWGIPTTVFGMLFCVYLFKEQYIKKHKINNFLFISILSAVILMYASTDLFPWRLVEDVFPMITLIQFPWRLMGISAFFLSFCSAIGLISFFNNWQFKNWIISLVGIIMCVISINTFLFSIEEDGKAVLHKWVYFTEYDLSNPAFFGHSDYLPLGTRFVQLRVRDNKYSYDPEKMYSEAEIFNVNRLGNRISFSYDANVDTNIALPLLYYPGYEALDETGNLLPVFQDKRNILHIKLPMGKHSVTLWYKGVTYFRISDGISMVGVFIFLRVLRKKYKGRC